LAIVGIIPARDGFPRLPGAPLSDIHGKTLMEKVCARARAEEGPDRVAAEDEARAETLAEIERARALPTPEKGRVA
jgi:CMP-2-keto-3-deoxyoctulosonic acid synthetase